MSSSKSGLTFATIILIIGMLSTGIITAMYTVNSQTNGPGASAFPNPVSSAIPENLQSNSHQATISSNSPQSMVSTSQPHYFLHEGKAPTGNSASVSSNNVFYNGGPTMHISVNYAIFWLPSVNSFEQSSGSNSAYISLIDRFLNDTGGTSYYNILNQYPDNISGTPLDKSILADSYVDTTPYPSTGTQSSPLHDFDIQNEVVHAMAANNWTPGPDKIFHVFTGYGIESCFDANNRDCTFTVYCAYHNFFTQGAQSIIYSNMPDFNGVAGRCTPQGESSPNGDYYADPEINILSHELFESVSDPQLNAWNDGFSEIGDKCAWNFGSVNPDGSNLVLSGHKYLVQLEWSNYGSNCVLSYGPSHSVSIGPSQGSDPFPSTISFNITYASQGSKWWTTTAYANGTLTLNVDENTQIAIANKTSTTSQYEKWCFDQNCSGTSFTSSDGSATTYYYYYDLLAQQVSVSPAVGVPASSLVYAAQSILPSTLGLPRQLTVRVNQTPQTIWALRGTAVSVDSPTNAGVNTRWVTGTSKWIISYAFQIPNPIVYYPQYLTTFEYTVSGGGFYSPPTVTYYDAGSAKTVLTGTAVWVDSTGGYTYQSQLPGSTQYERWSVTSPTGQVSAPRSTVSTSYYHEYNVTISYQLTSGSPSASPYLIGETSGLNIPTRLSLQASTVWLDAGSSYSITNNLLGFSRLERWQAAGQTSGIVGGAMILSPEYVHQYFLAVTGAPQGSAGQGWYDSGATALATSPGIYGSSSITRSRLISYVIDSGAPTILNTIDPVPVSVTMNLPHNIHFSSTIQYLLTSVLPTNSISSMTPSPTGDSWYDNGTSVFVVLNRSWDAIGSIRQSLVSYSVDNSATFVIRVSGGPVDLLAITMTTSHVLSEQSATQYLISVQGASVSGSQTGDGWFDFGSQFTVEGRYSQTYAADLPYHIYGLPVGFQILANSTVESSLWMGSNNTLSLNASRVDVTIYIPSELNLSPSYVLDDGSPIVFSYTQANHRLGFAGSSQFRISFSSSVSSASFLPGISDWVLYPVIIAIVVGAILFLGLLLVRRGTRKIHA